MHIVAINKKTGRLILSQQEGDPKVIKQNAINAGIAAKDIEIREMDDADHDAIIAVQADADMGYAEKRRREYPAIGDQLDAIMKWLATETEVTVPAELKSLASKCMSVKAKYPKE